jgi:hypothetical protein
VSCTNDSKQPPLVSNGPDQLQFPLEMWDPLVSNSATMVGHKLPQKIHSAHLSLRYGRVGASGGGGGGSGGGSGGGGRSCLRSGNHTLSRERVICHSSAVRARDGGINGVRSLGKNTLDRSMRQILLQLALKLFGCTRKNSREIDVVVWLVCGRVSAHGASGSSLSFALSFAFPFAFAFSALPFAVITAGAGRRRRHRQCAQVPARNCSGAGRWSKRPATSSPSCLVIRATQGHCQDLINASDIEQSEVICKGEG